MLGALLVLNASLARVLLLLLLQLQRSHDPDGIPAAGGAGVPPLALPGSSATCLGHSARNE